VSAASGSRARSREIGYAEAMRDMALTLEGHARMQRRAELYAAERGNWHAAEIFALTAERTDEYVSVAWAIWDLHGDGKPLLDPGSTISRNWESSRPPHETGNFPAVR
jgi:hypothetical protein